MNITKNDVTKYIQYIRLNYPKAFAFTGTNDEIAVQNKLLIASWFDLLQGYTKEQCDRAVKNAVANLTYGDYPKISDIIKELKPVAENFQANNLWAEFLSKRGMIVKAGERLVDTFHSGNDKDFAEARKALITIFDNLSIGLKRYFVNWDGLYFTATLDDKALQYEKNTFFKTIKEQQENPDSEIMSKEYGALFIKGDNKKIGGAI